MNQLHSYPIETPTQVEAMRLIYNENLASLATRPLPYRNEEDQQQWWESNKHCLRAYLYEPLERPGVVVGFLVLRDRGGFVTPTIALCKDEWGKGFGKELVFDYVIKANGPMAGSQLQSNTAICHLNRKVGWQILGKRDEPECGPVDLLFHPGNNPDQPVSAEVFAAVLDYLNLKSCDLPTA
jgi:hypothetical protein